MQKLSFSIATDKINLFAKCVDFHRDITNSDIYYVSKMAGTHWTTMEMSINTVYADAFISLINNYQLNCPY